MSQSGMLHLHVVLTIAEGQELVTLSFENWFQIGMRAQQRSVYRPCAALGAARSERRRA